MADEITPSGGGLGEPTTNEELRAATVRGLRWTSVGRLTIEVSLFASMIVLARLIPPAEFGPYAVAVIAQELVMGIQSQGVGNALVQRPNAGREHLQAGQAIMLISGLILAGLTYLSAGLIAEPIFGHATAELVKLSTPFCVITALGIVPTSLLRRRLEFSKVTMIDLSGSLTRAFASIGLAVIGAGAKSLILGTLIAAVVGTIAACIYAPPPFPRLRRKAAREIMEYGLPASLASISWTAFRNCDYAIVGVRLGTLQAGLYFRAYNLGVEYQKKFSDLIGTVVFPVLARTSSPEAMAAFRGQVVRLLTTLMFPLLTLLAIVAPVFIPWLLGPAWAPAVVPTQILALGGASTLVIDTAGVALAAAGRSRAMLGFGVSHFIGYATVVWFVSPHGIIAVAIAAAVVHTVFLFVSYAMMLSGMSERALRHLWTDVAPATLASLGLAAVAVPASIVLSAAHIPALAQVMAVTALGGVAYLLTLRVCFPGPAGELYSGISRVVPLDAIGRRLRRRPPLGFAPPEPSA
jgi:lipopolysaccharide exporter